MNKDYGLRGPENKTWEEDWKDILSTDSNKDGDFLIRLMIHKLVLMRREFSIIDNGRRNSNLINQISGAIDLGQRILVYNYGKEADDYFRENYTVNWVVDQPEEYKHWLDLSSQAIMNRKIEVKSFFKYIGDNIINWWGE